MKEIDFRNWLSTSTPNKKVVSDTISRLKKLEHELDNINIDHEFSFDKCQTLLSFFSNKGINDYSKSFVNCNLPIGKYQLSTYKCALQKYIIFLNEKNED